MNLSDVTMRIAAYERKPTVRERWHAFWRLWRICHAKQMNAHHHHGADEALRVLFWRNWRLLQLADSAGGTLELARFMPSSIRRNRVNLARAMRERKEADRKAQQLLAAIMRGPDSVE